jgi:hypothetical protein
MTDPAQTANAGGYRDALAAEMATEEEDLRPLTYQGAMAMDLTDQRARYEDLTDRSMMARSLATLQARGDYDADKHPDPAKYPPLTAAEHVELLALGEAIGFYYRHPSQVDHAVRAGASWDDIAAAANTTPESARTAYRQWARGQRDYAGMPDAVYLEAMELAGEEPDLGMVIRSLSAEGLKDVLLTLTDRRPDLVGRALADVAYTWQDGSPDELAAREAQS